MSYVSSSFARDSPVQPDLFGSCLSSRDLSQLITPAIRSVLSIVLQIARHTN